MNNNIIEIRPNLKNVCFNKVCENYSGRLSNRCREWIIPGKDKCQDYKTKSQWERIVRKR
jgi:hypothetical protein